MIEYAKCCWNCRYTGGSTETYFDGRDSYNYCSIREVTVSPRLVCEQFDLTDSEKCITRIQEDLEKTEKSSVYETK